MKYRKRGNVLCSWCEHRGATINATEVIDGERLALTLHGGCRAEMDNWLRFRRTGK